MNTSSVMEKSTGRYRNFSLRPSLIALVAGLGLAIALLSSPAVVMATSVNRLAICNLEAYPGETVDTEVTLQSTDPGERTGYWSTHYKEVDGDDATMDITSWISFEPASEYTLAEGETKAFKVKISVPGDAQAGLWGATSEKAGESGHSGERRTYIIFKDTSTGGSIYSGLLIPVSVKVVGKPSPLAPVISWVKANVMVSVLILVVIVLLAVMLRRRRLSKADS
ncbi:MAG: hypothetical protein JW790_03350 [Dehalococcoidales bacterium]|nr:hypothetical protein [Dehalococcoidales bacterium]